MEPTEREEVVAGSFQSVVEAELQKPKHSLAREKEVGSRAHDQTLRGYRVGSGVGSSAGVGSFCYCARYQQHRIDKAASWQFR
jgi:hypothetical protein